jgi:hypothetical protein
VLSAHRLKVITAWEAIFRAKTLMALSMRKSRAVRSALLRVDVEVEFDYDGRNIRWLSSPWRRAVLRGHPDAWLSLESWGVHVAMQLFRRGVRAIAAVSLAALSSSCVLTGDLPNLSLDVPQRYQAAELLDPDGTTPTLDWWRGFRWNELTQLMEEVQTVNLDIASAVSRIRQADAQARIAGAPLLPNISGTGSETHSLTSGSSSSGLSSVGCVTVS